MNHERTVIVTGATGNLGSAVVDKFHSEKWKVIGTVMKGEEVKNKNFEAYTVDLVDDKDSSDFIKKILSKNNSIDAAVLTAGGFAMSNIADTTATDIRKQYALNFETAYNIAQPVFKQMMKQSSGRIFLIGARPGLSARYSKGMVAYGLSKSLLFRLAELMNEEAKHSNVVTSVIVPSTIDTPENRASMPDADPTRWVKAESIADIIFYHTMNEVIREPVIKVYNRS